MKSLVLAAALVAACCVSAAQACPVSTGSVSVAAVPSCGVAVLSQEALGVPVQVFSYGVGVQTFAVHPQAVILQDAPVVVQRRVFVRQRAFVRPLFVRPLFERPFFRRNVIINRGVQIQRF